MKDPTRNLIQFQNCQDIWRWTTYCAYPSRWVRCAAQHPSSTCPKSRDTPAKCNLCKGDHPASYKGYQVHNNLQNFRHPRSTINHSFQNQIQPNINLQGTGRKAETTPPNSHLKTYANVTANLEPPSIHNTNKTDTGTMLANFIN